MQPDVIPLRELVNVLSMFTKELPTLLGQKIPKEQLSALMNTIFTSVVKPIEPPLPTAKLRTTVPIREVRETSKRKHKGSLIQQVIRVKSKNEKALTVHTSTLKKDV